MLNWLITICLASGDALFGWLLAVSPEATVLLLAAISAAAFVLVRRLATSQPLLADVAYDLDRVAELVRQARAEGDAAEVARLRRLQNRLRMKRLGQEWRPLLIVFVPLLALGVWAGERLEFRPPREGEPFVLRLQGPYSKVGSVAHIVPRDDVQCEAWIQAIVANEEAISPIGSAEWTLVIKESAETSPRPVLVVQLPEQRLPHPTEAGFAERYPLAIQHDESWTTQLLWPRVDFGGLLDVGAWRAYGFPPAWLIVYLVLTLPLTWLLKRVMGVY